MIKSAEILELLGHSEMDADVQKFLSLLGFASKIPRPKKGDSEVRLSFNSKGLELGFSEAETLPDSFGAGFPEGALIMDVIFFLPVQPPNAIYVDLPFGLRDFSHTRAEVRNKLGRPAWSSPIAAIKNDSWHLDRFKTTMDFNKDELSIKMLTVQLAKAT